MWKSSFEANLIQDIMDMREEVFCKVLLDLRKVHDSLDQYQCLEVLVAYGIRPRMTRLLRTYWERLMMVAWTGSQYSEPFMGTRGMTHV